MSVKIVGVRGLVLAACLCVLAVPALAVAQDTVVMVNGDRLTGEVKELSRGQLKFDPDFADSFMLDWSKVASIATSGAFDLVTETGDTYVGRLQTRFAGQVDVLDFNGASVVTLALIEVVALAPIRTSFIKNLDGSVSLGGSYTQSSGIAQMSFDASVVYRQPSFEASARGSASFTQDPDSDDTSRYSLQLGVYANSSERVDGGAVRVVREQSRTRLRSAFHGRTGRRPVSHPDEPGATDAGWRRGGESRIAGGW